MTLLLAGFAPGSRGMGESALGDRWCAEMAATTTNRICKVLTLNTLQRTSA